jgi:DNA invertase Pin-like site-specific DNA recombinase
LYSRVSTDQQTLAQQERTVYEWLNAHHMKVDRVVSDEGVSGGVSYADRKLGKELLPMTVEGDMIIVSEISRLGRSMFDLSKLIHTELKPRKLRLVVVSMGIDLNCAKMTAIDELILNNFSFAAQLEKQLISERTLSALAVKKKQGVKLGAASPIYQERYKLKSSEERVMIHRKKGVVKNARFLQKKDTVAFLKVLTKVFPEACVGEPTEWKWNLINTKEASREKIIEVMNTFKEIDPTLFPKWNLSGDEAMSTKTQVKMANQITTLRRSILRNETINNTFNQ